MKGNSIAGTTLRWTFEDGSAAGKTYLHKFNTDGSVDFRPVTSATVSKGKDKDTHVDKYESARIDDDTYVVAYRGPEGYTLTTVLDFKTGRMVGFASNEKMLEQSHGEFEAVSGDKEVDQAAEEADAQMAHSGAELSEPLR